MSGKARHARMSRRAFAVTALSTLVAGGAVAGAALAGAEPQPVDGTGPGQAGDAASCAACGSRRSPTGTGRRSRV